ncbi:hypothetical protein EKO04_011268 [Ascochyta lentis]|uniref:Reverse transcriptase domain-containing protein n=1 Tax=Ascochyta lentis TaxID=205686 RepID=A0A8H7IVR4_9PLEO|nr:hypothetical protein EKO04_011268 [Ascochyta lentis]
MKVQAKLYGDQPAYPTEKDQVNYVITRTTGQAFNALSPMIMSLMNGTTLPTLKKAWAYLDGFFKDPTAQEKALEYLRTTKQGKNDFNLHVQKFNLKLQEAALDGASHAQKIDYLKNSLNKFTLDIRGVLQHCVAAYITPSTYNYNIILRKTWLEDVGGVISTKDKLLSMERYNVTVRSTEVLTPLDCCPVSAVAFQYHVQKSRKENSGIQVFAASIKDIQKALKPKTQMTVQEVKAALPAYLQSYVKLFVPEEDGKTPEVPYGPLYAMSRDELLVLRRTLLDLLEKGFIRASNSPAASPVLFVQKPGGRLQFCVDYRALNALTKKDRYPLPLIKETLNMIGQATWYTKLDVTAAFHKIRIAEGQEWMTAFRTRFGSYEWLVTPFGLANAPSTFQRYINWALREFLDDFASAYLDDVLIFTEGSLHKHHKHVQQQAPTTVKGVQGFLRFANFYRKFIKDFATLSEPLVRLTKKDLPFKWTEEQDQAFQALKEAFLSDEVLATLNPEQRAVVECDSSGFAIGATLSQEDASGNLRTVAYLSRKFLPHKANYPIHDKELLAVIFCLQE